MNIAVIYLFFWKDYLGINYPPITIQRKTGVALMDNLEKKQIKQFRPIVLIQINEIIILTNGTEIWYCSERRLQICMEETSRTLNRDSSTNT